MNDDCRPDTPPAPPCLYRIDKDIPAGPGPWICLLPEGHPPHHKLTQEHPHG